MFVIREFLLVIFDLVKILRGLKLVKFERFFYSSIRIYRSCIILRCRK